jgi:hypothetical protein
MDWILYVQQKTISKLTYIQQTYAPQNVALQIICFTQAHKKLQKQDIISITMQSH